MLRRNFSNCRALPVCRQRGVSLMELMIAMAISLVVSLAMVSLMANTMGTGTKTIQMTRLTEEMRTAMQLITRDLRRANYHWNVADCYANINCNPDTTRIKAIAPVGGSCFRFWYDRAGDNDLDVGTFQRWVRGGVGVIQMTTRDTATSACGTEWGASRDITNPNIVNVTAFNVSSADSYVDALSTTDTQTVSKIRMTMTAQLRNNYLGTPITKTIEDMIFVRNNVYCPAGTCP